MMCGFPNALTFPERARKNGCLQSGYVAGPLASGMYSKLITEIYHNAKSNVVNRHHRFDADPNTDPTLFFEF
jgi:hypothetical protein